MTIVPPRGLAAIALACCAGALPALELGTVELHGFISQGYLETNRNEFIDGSDEGSFAFSEAALMVMAQPVDRLRIGAQLFARRFGENDQNDELVLDWAYGDYRMHDLLGVRLGKVRMPKGLYNEIQDVDAARTSILLPQSVYNTHMRDFWTAYVGGGLYGSTPTTRLGSFEYHGWGGTPSVPDDGTTARYFGGDANTTLSEDYTYGLQLIWNTPVPGLRVGGTYSYYNYLAAHIDEEPIAAPSPPFPPNTPFSIDKTYNLRDVHAYVLSAEWTWRDLRLTGEYARQTMDILVDFENAMLPDQQVDGDTEGWYLAASYRIHPRIEIGSYWSLYHDTHRDQRRTIKADYTEDFAFSALFEVNSNWLIKAEYHQIYGTALLPMAQQQSGDEQWSLFAIKTTFTF